MSTWLILFRIIAALLISHPSSQFWAFRDKQALFLTAAITTLSVVMHRTVGPLRYEYVGVPPVCAHLVSARRVFIEREFEQCFGLQNVVFK